MIIDINDTCLKCSAFAYACAGCRSNEFCGCKDPDYLHYDAYAMERINKCIDSTNSKGKWLSKEEWNEQMHRKMDHLTHTPISTSEPEDLDEELELMEI